MLKKIRLLFLGLIVLAGSACVTPTHASSASTIILAYVQAAGPTGAKEELVVLHNNSSTEVDITGWCLMNKTDKPFACFAPETIDGGMTQYVVPAYGDITVASQEYLAAHAIEASAVSLSYTVTNQSSGSITNGGDTISVIDPDGFIFDVWTWESQPPSGKAWMRTQAPAIPSTYVVTGNPADWDVTAWREMPENSVEIRSVPNADDNEGTGVSRSSLMITELLPNPTGTDKGHEFIELYNPDLQTAQSLDGLQLRFGLETAKWYALPAGVSIPPLGYSVFSDTDLGFTLPNTTGVVQLYSGSVALGASVTYTAPKDDMAWALVDDEWQYTSMPTPGAKNMPSPINTTPVVASVVLSLKPCADNQYRNPETGRCKLLSSAVTVPTPCKAGQVRNLETNRCRTVSAPKVPAPCKEGQERNPETNRCRNVVKMTDANFGVKNVQTQASAQLQWYYWAAIGAVVLLILGYAVWEWRQELMILWQRLRTRFAKR